MKNDGRFYDRYIQYMTHVMEPCRSLDALKLQIDEKIQELQDRFYHAQFRLINVSIEHYAAQDRTSQVRSYIDQWTALIVYHILDTTKQEYNEGGMRYGRRMLEEQDPYD